MKKFKLLSLLLILTLLLCALPVSALAVDEPVSGAQSVILVDTDTGEILYEKNADMSVNPGALTMLMTALVVGDSLQTQSIGLDDSITLSETFRYNITESSTVTSPNIMPGEMLTVQQLLYLAVLSSAEDAANALAEYTAGSADAFTAAMNARAQELGCTATYFVNPGGTYAQAQLTTARDLALIARAVFQSPSVLTAFQTASYTVPGTNLSAERPVTCPNALMLASDPQYYDLAYAGKTATTGLGGSLVAAASYNGVDVTVVILGCPEGVDRFTEARDLFEWTFSNFSFRTLVSTTDVLATLPVAMGSPESVSIRSDDTIQVLMPNDADASDVTIDIVYQHELDGIELEAPISVGQYMGEATISLNGTERGKVRLVAATTVDVSRTDYLKTQLDVMLHNPSVRQIVTILLAALGVYLLLVVFYLFQRLLHLNSLRRARRARAKARSRQEIQWLDVPADGEAPDYLPEGAYPQDEDYPQEEYPEEEYPEEEYPEEEYSEEEPYPEEEYPEEEPEEDAGEEPEEDGRPYQVPDGEEYADGDEGYYDDEEYDGEEYDDENSAYFDGDGEDYDDEPDGRR